MTGPPPKASSIRIVPVLDLLGGVVVRAIGGRRHEYAPLVSPLATSADPREVAFALLKATSSEELYVADLDAILHEGQLSAATQRLLAECPATIWLDAGFRDPEQVQQLAGFPRVQPILASETLQRWPKPVPPRAMFSLDLKQGHLQAPGWPEIRSALELADRAAEIGFESMIVLDVAAVGEGAGPRTLELCQQLRQRHPGLELIGGGGIRHRADAEAFRSAGCNAVLVSTALHTGQWLKPYALPASA